MSDKVVCSCPIFWLFFKHRNATIITLNCLRTFIEILNGGCSSYRHKGMSVISSSLWSVPDGVFSTDACLSGCGGLTDLYFFHCEFPAAFTTRCHSIHYLEAIAILTACCLWGSSWQGLRIIVQCDNEPVVSDLLVIQLTNPPPSTMDDKNQPWNVCPFHDCNRIQLECESDDESYIKCQRNSCPIFMNEDSAYDYMTNI